jgi:Protein of unknown function (DUF402)
MGWPRRAPTAALGRDARVWVFWSGPGRDFTGWYVNLQEPFRRTKIGIDTQDLELDIVVSVDGSWQYKDDEELDAWIERGRWTPAEVAAIWAEGKRICQMLDAGERWWSDEWATWRPDPDWPLPRLTPTWDREPG